MPLWLRPATLPHGMGYPLSHRKGMYHGHASAVTLGEYLRIFTQPENVRKVKRIIELCGFDGIDEMCGYIDGIICRDVDIEVTESEIAEWSDEVMQIDFRIHGHPEPDIKSIYRRALKRYIKIRTSGADVTSAPDVFCCPDGEIGQKALRQNK